MWTRTGVEVDGELLGGGTDGNGSVPEQALVVGKRNGTGIGALGGELDIGERVVKASVGPICGNILLVLARYDRCKIVSARRNLENAIDRLTIGT